MKFGKLQADLPFSMHGRSMDGSISIQVLPGRISLARQVSSMLRMHAHYYTGLLVLALFMLQYLFGLRWEWLAQLQQQEFYKQLTGYVMFVYLLFQWELGIARKRYPGKVGKGLLFRHRYQGALAPLVLYLHSMELGYAYQWVLGSAFLMNCFLGLLHRDVLRSSHALLIKGWLSIHISLAVVVSMLIPYHVYIIYRY